MEIAATVLGAAAIVVALWDMFQTLLHPRGRGRLSQRVLAGLWWLSRRSGHRLGTAVGPASMVTVIVMWIGLLGAGWALVYFPHVPQGFLYSPGIDPADYSTAGQALYVSFVTLGTLGFGDVVPTTPLLRLVTPLEALTGFAALTAALTWFMQIPPPLMRRRALALHLRGLAEVDYAGRLAALDVAAISRELDSVTAQLRTVRIDFAQHTEGFYFPEPVDALNLSRQLPTVLRLYEAARAHASPTVQLAAEQLAGALKQLTDTLDEKFLSTPGGPEAVISVFAEEHRQ